MKALAYHRASKRTCEEKPKSSIKPSTDAIVKITKPTICGTDLHIMKGDVQEFMERLILDKKDY
jgi:alcohol dehydrogenase